MTSPLRAALRDRLKAAMRARDGRTAGAMRTVIAALENAEAVPVKSTGTPVTSSEYVAGTSLGPGSGEFPRRVLSPDEERALVAREVAELRLSSATLAKVGRHKRSAEMLRIAETVEEVLEC
jgi:hypothetical protein